MGLTAFVADAVLAALVGRTPLAPPPRGALWLALLLDTHGPEIAFAGYSRPELPPSVWGEPTGGELRNAQALPLPRPPAGEIGPVTAFGLLDGPDTDAVLRFTGACRPFLLTADDDAPNVPAGTLRLQLA
jgi:hypothetical protein